MKKISRAVGIVLAALMLCTLLPAGAALASGNTMFIYPATQTVAPGDTFTVEVRMDTDRITTGAQTDITFNPALIWRCLVSRRRICILED